MNKMAINLPEYFSFVKFISLLAQEFRWQNCSINHISISRVPFFFFFFFQTHEKQKEYNKYLIVYQLCLHTEKLATHHCMAQLETKVKYVLLMNECVNWNNKPSENCTKILNNRSIVHPSNN